MLANHHITARSIRSRYLKDLFVQYRGAVAAYDEGFARESDAVLATALWRNLWAARKEVDYRDLAVVVSYVRRVVGGLERIGDDVLGMGRIRFGDPAVEGVVVDGKSRLWDEPFGEEDFVVGERGKEGK
jgi:cytochrome b pre-mRNA-processing protein 3